MNIKTISSSYLIEQRDLFIRIERRDLILNKIDLGLKRLILISCHQAYLYRKGYIIGEKHKTSLFRREHYLYEFEKQIRVNSGVIFVMFAGSYWLLHIEKVYFGTEFQSVYDCGKIVMKDYVDIEANATVMPSVSIDDKFIIVCVAIVIYNVSSNSIWVGNNWTNWNNGAVCPRIKKNCTCNNEYDSCVKERIYLESFDQIITKHTTNCVLMEGWCAA